MTASKTNYQKCVAALTSITIKYPQILDEFITWYKDGMWDDEGLTDEFSHNDFEDCSFIDCIKENNQIKTEKQGLEIWQLLRNAVTLLKATTFDPKSCITTIDPSESGTTYKYTTNNIVIKLLSTNLQSTEQTQHIHSKSSPTKQRLQLQSPMILPHESNQTITTAQDIIYTQYIGYKNGNYPLLMHFVDSYVRCKLNIWILTGKKQLAIPQFFAKYCNNPHFKQYLQTKHSQHRMKRIITAIQSYHNRVVPAFKCIEPVYKIRESPLAITKYLFEMTRIVGRIADIPVYNLTTIIPLQIDFMIINKDILFTVPFGRHCKGISQLFDSDDEYDEEDEKRTDVNTDKTLANDIDALLTAKGIKYYTYDVLSRWHLSVEKIIELTENQRSKRIVFVFDRRKGSNTSGRLYLFKPNKCYEFEKNRQDLVHSSLHYNSVKSMLPRAGYVGNNCDDLGVRQSLCGQMFVISYHILSKDEIRCYLFYGGQCFRFFGEDLINVLPVLFDKKAADVLLRKYNGKSDKDKEWRRNFNEFCNTFCDNKFELFYHGLTGKKPQIDVIQKHAQKSQ